MRRSRRVAAMGTHVCVQNKSDQNNSQVSELHGAQSQQCLLLRADKHCRGGAGGAGVHDVRKPSTCEPFAVADNTYNCC